MQQVLRKRLQRWLRTTVSMQALLIWMDTTNRTSPTSSVFSSSPQHGVREKCQIMLKLSGNPSNQVHQRLRPCTTPCVPSETRPMTNSAKQGLTGMVNFPVLVQPVSKKSNCAMLTLNHHGLSGSKKHSLVSLVSMIQEPFNLNSSRK